MSEHEMTGVTAAEWLDRDLDRPGLVVQGVPTSAAGTAGSDAWQAPAALRQLLSDYATFDSEHGVDLEELRVADWGDWLVSHMDAGEAHELIARSSEALPTQPVFVFLGGDNSVTHSILANLPHTSLDRFGLVTFDARHDVDAAPQGTPHHHRAHLRRLLDDGLDPQHVVQIGVHGFAASLRSRAWCDQRGVRVATRTMIQEHGLERIVDEALAYLDPEVDAIYIDCDLSVLDRAQAPGCVGSRPGGLTAADLATAMLRCGAHPKVVAADLVEVDPLHDVAQITLTALARVFLSFAAGVAMRDTGGLGR